MEKIKMDMDMDDQEKTGKGRWQAILSYIGIALLFVFGLFARRDMSQVTSDLRAFVIPWYDFIQSRGFLAAMGKNFSNYTPPYTYLVALMTLTASFLPKVTAIKLISVTADFINAFLVYRIVRLKYFSGLLPLWAAGIYLCLPTIFVNSAIWGQADAVYTVFLLASLYFFLKEKPLWGMLMFSVSFAFKAQAVFLAPFLVVLLFKKRVKIWHLLLVPVIYALLCLPVVLLGRSWLDVFTVYLNQGETFQWLSANAPTLYIFLSNQYYQTFLEFGLMVAFASIFAWIVLTLIKNKPFGRDRLALLALVSVALLPFLLPKMHERYFYPADVFSLVLAFFFPEMWFVPLAYQAISGLSYTVYMLNAPVSNVYIAAVANLGIIVFLLWKQFHFQPALLATVGNNDENRVG
jgi:Gpi18-like mannosyltransferase